VINLCHCLSLCRSFTDLYFTYLVYGPLALGEAFHADVHGEEIPDKAPRKYRWEATLDATGS